MPFGLDDALFGVAVNLVSSALWDLAHDPLYEEEYQPAERGSAAYAKAIGTAVGELAPTLSDVTADNRRVVADFIGSDEVRRLVLQLYRTRITEPAASLSTLRRGLAEIWRARHPGQSPAIDLDRALDALVSGCDEVLASAIKRESVTAHEAMSAARHSMTIERLDGIERQLAFLASHPGVAVVHPEQAEQVTGHYLAAAADEFEQRLRAAVIACHGWIQMSVLAEGRHAPIDDLYVAPPFTIVPRTEPTLYEQLARETFRVVVLGAPGAGKSSLARKICVDLARNATSLSGGLHPTGILLSLRAVGDRDLHDKSLRGRIKSLLASRYQVSAEPRVVEYLLEAGRLALIFDGLDELPTADDRRRVRDDLEALASVYPQAPIVVTSRIVGYAYAPLDERRYRLAYLSEYSDVQVAEYARRWFALTYDEPVHAEATAGRFLQESESVPDLRTNPLLLQLLCALYRREGHISRFRADLYEACSTMLFSTWDLRRGSGPDLRRLRPAVSFLAWRILSDPALANGINHPTAIAEIADYLLQHRLADDDDEAVAAAAALLEFSTQRAWVFTEIGVDERGDSVYHFTHRTFLEFFAAEHIVSARDVEKVAAAMLSRLLVGDETVPGLAFDRYGRTYEHGYRTLMTELLERAATPAEHDAVVAFRGRIADDRDGWSLPGP